ncbi:E3 ubiquitin ligase Bre1 like protein [Aduncisulcus paluster]|uniref:E3 ubiquitin protein ligase n=1 Tax=Aduncisulcus paluster TaxID=2918883 RepID=A0ABQ5KKW6_9EUKA|nr:E3 ubiquitin ligase Bre1 like protein [Aduncisulcus paluster]
MGDLEQTIILKQRDALITKLAAQNSQISSLQSDLELEKEEKSKLIGLLFEHFSYVCDNIKASTALSTPSKTPKELVDFLSRADISTCDGANVLVKSIHRLSGLLYESKKHFESVPVKDEEEETKPVNLDAPKEEESLVKKEEEEDHKESKEAQPEVVSKPIPAFIYCPNLSPAGHLASVCEDIKLARRETQRRVIDREVDERAFVSQIKSLEEKVKTLEEENETLKKNQSSGVAASSSSSTSVHSSASDSASTVAPSKRRSAAIPLSSAHSTRKELTMDDISAITAENGKVKAEASNLRRKMEKQREAIGRLSDRLDFELKKFKAVVDVFESSGMPEPSIASINSLSAIINPSYFQSPGNPVTADGASSSTVITPGHLSASSSSAASLVSGSEAGVDGSSSLQHNSHHHHVSIGASSSSASSSASGTTTSTSVESIAQAAMSSSVQSQLFNPAMMATISPHLRTISSFIEGKNNTIDTLKKKLLATDDTIDGLEKEIAVMKNFADERRKASSDLDAQLVKLREEIDVHMQRAVEREKKATQVINDSNATVCGAEKAMEEWKTKFEEEHDLFLAIEKELMAERAKNTSHHERVSALFKKVSEIGSKDDVMPEDDVEEVRKETEEAWQEVDDVNEQLSEVQKELSSVRALLNTLKRNDAMNKSEIATLKKRLEQKESSGAFQDGSSSSTTSSVLIGAPMIGGTHSLGGVPGHDQGQSIGGHDVTFTLNERILGLKAAKETEEHLAKALGEQLEKERREKAKIEERWAQIRKEKATAIAELSAAKSTIVGMSQHQDKSKLIIRDLEVKRDSLLSKCAGLKGALDTVRALWSGASPDKEIAELKLLRDELKANVYCPQCALRSPRNVVISTCGHTFCNSCVEEVLDSRLRKCPTCGGKFHKQDVIPIFLPIHGNKL